ncbi:hypothetical protein F4781DRAFT_438501 [Annulohypoxylon bovei var. microspora]|nr:hypothetical protein F4781DRAFT_438501 [Annulohypoxylon bovei var. microspora]
MSDYAGQTGYTFYQLYTSTSPTASRRGNGSQASCERCRKAKIRCDHLKPICGPCRRRGLEAQCWYHPAPLTKQLDSQRSIPPNSRNNSAIRLSNFFMWPSILNHPNGLASRIPIYESHDEKSYEGHLAVAEEIVSQLKFLPFIEKLFDEYFSFSQIAPVPRQIILQLVKSIHSNLAIPNGNCEETVECIPGTSQLAKNILHSSSSEVTLTSAIDPKSFCALFCGENFRVETLGLLYTIAARSYLYNMINDKKKHESFIRDMVRCSNLSLKFARDLSTQTNDFIVWLAHDNIQLTTLIEGEPSLGVWRRLGDLATDLFALGLHRETTYSADTTPFFLAECRRKTFATAYHLDKFFVAVFNRPPRIPGRYVDCKLPLDLSEDELFATSPEIVEQAWGKLSPDGWGTGGGYRTTQWARIRYMLARFREETIEYQFRSVQSLDHAEVRSLLTRSREAWEALPHHLRYDSNCWTSNIPPAVCLMLGKVYLSYLHIQLQLYKLLGQGDTTPQPELVQISASMLETVIRMSKVRGRAVFFARDLPVLVLSYDLPSAIVLITALQEIARSPLRSTPPEVNRAPIIRHLSVLVSQLESVFSPSETAYEFCIQAAKIISHKLDLVIDNFTIQVAAMPLDITPDPNDSPMSVSTQTGPSCDTPASGSVNFENVNFDDIDGLGPGLGL